MIMQAFQHQYSNNNNNDNNNNCTNFESVREFLNHCHLSQYYDVFISEGFDSISSLLEITEEDMIVMNIKRGHRRLIQREIATAKGIPRDQPLVTNIMGPKYSLDIPSSLKIEHSRGPTANYASSGYETLITDMTSPRSMNSGMGGSNTSGNSSSNNSGPNLTSRFIPPNMAALSDSHNNNNNSNNNNNNGSSNNNNSNAKSSIDTTHGGRSSSRSSSTNEIIPNQTIIRSTSISSNEDNESVQSDSTAPKRKYRRHAKPDRNAPIKPPSAYIMFSNDSRAKLKDQNLSFAELAKVVGEQWKNLSYYEKQAYERKAMRAKDEYLAALERYRETDEYKRYQQYLKEFKAKQESANRLIDRARKRAKQKSPGSGSAADASSNGNSTGNGSSGSSGSSGDNNDKDSMPSMSQTKDSPPHRAYVDQPMTNDYQDVENYRHQQQEQQEQPSSSPLPEQQHPQWNYRSDQMMRGIIPVEFVHTPQPKYSNNNDNENPNNLQVLSGSKHPLDTDTPYQERPHKRRSPRLRKPSSE